MRQSCRELDAAARLPRVILSDGMHISEFLGSVDLAVGAGGCGQPRDLTYGATPPLNR